MQYGRKRTYRGHVWNPGDRVIVPHMKNRTARDPANASIVKVVEGGAYVDVLMDDGIKKRVHSSLPISPRKED